MGVHPKVRRLVVLRCYSAAGILRLNTQCGKDNHFSSGREVFCLMGTSKRRPAPPGFRWVFCRYRRVRNSSRYLDARDYGYDSWCFLVRA